MRIANFVILPLFFIVIASFMYSQNEKLQIHDSKSLIFGGAPETKVISGQGSYKLSARIQKIADYPLSDPLPQRVMHNVPFTPQAPFADWGDSRQQNACEESSVLMALRWASGIELDSAEALKEILAIVEYERDEYGHFHDSSAQDTYERIVQGYFKYEAAELRYGIAVADIKKELVGGNLVIVPVDGTVLKNPFFTPPGPTEHMIVVTGYDDDTEEFITNDPGTRRGESFRYKYDILQQALRDYSSGYHEIIQESQTAMIVIKKLKKENNL